MKNYLLALFAISLMWGCSKEAMLTQDGTASNDGMPGKKVETQSKKTKSVRTSDFNQIFTIPCSNNGEGEEVSVVGTSELTTETTISGTIVTTVMEFEILNGKGVGAATGNMYSAVGGSTTTIITSTKDSRYNYNYDEKITVSAPGSNNSLFYRLTASQANGPKGNVLKAYKVDEFTDCN